MIVGSNFLIPNATLLVEIVAFLVVLGFLAKKVLPILNKVIEERQEQIRSSLASAEEARAEADESREQRAKILDDARKQGRDIVAQANATADRVKAEAIEKGQAEHDRLVNSAEAEITLARRRAVEEVSEQLTALVVSTARQVIGREVDAANHRDLIDAAVEALRSSSDTVAARSRG